MADASTERWANSFAEKARKMVDNALMAQDTLEWDTIPACKENLSTNAESYHHSPFLERTRAGHASRRGSKTGSVASTLFGEAPADLADVQDPQSYIRERFTQLETRLEEYLDVVTEDIAQDLEREQQHLILMQEQVDKQGQMLNRELTALHKKVDGETTRRSFVSSEVRGTKEALEVQLERQGRELIVLQSSPWARDLLEYVPQAKPERLPEHTGELEPVLPAEGMKS